MYRDFLHPPRRGRHVKSDDCVCVIGLDMTTPPWWRGKSWYIIFIITIIIKKNRQCMAGSERLTSYQSEDQNPAIPTHSKKEEKMKMVKGKMGASS